jgi:hypothetical protein
LALLLLLLLLLLPEALMRRRLLMPLCRPRIIRRQLPHQRCGHRPQRLPPVRRRHKVDQELLGASSAAGGAAAYDDVLQQAGARGWVVRLQAMCFAQAQHAAQQLVGAVCLQVAPLDGQHGGVGARALEAQSKACRRPGLPAAAAAPAPSAAPAAAVAAGRTTAAACSLGGGSSEAELHFVAVRVLPAWRAAQRRQQQLLGVRHTRCAAQQVCHLALLGRQLGIVLQVL